MKLLWKHLNNRGLIKETRRLSPTYGINHAFGSDELKIRYYNASVKKLDLKKTGGLQCR